jgi:hypothetical protein
VFLFFLPRIQLHAQISCPNGLVYWNINPMKAYNPALSYSASNPVNTGIPPGAGGLSLGPNLNGTTPSPTFYTVSGGFFAYWNGSAWVSTGHVSTLSAGNIGHGPGCLYNINAPTGQIYKYVGTGQDVLLVTIPFGGGGPYDVVVDNCCNFYVIKTQSPQALWCYSPTGVLTSSCTLSGLPSSSAGGGFAIVGTQVVVGNGGGLWVGNMSGGNISFTNITTTITAYNDFANCPIDCGGPCGVPLFVSFTDFQGKMTSSGNELTWKTETVLNVEHFSVQRSTDAQHFEELEKVLPRTLHKEYTFKDPDPVKNVLNYYRIVAVENSGEQNSTYVIHLRPISLNTMAASSVYPNPATSELSVMIESALPSSATMNLYDPSGRLIRSVTKEMMSGITGISLSLEDLSNGIYLVQVLDVSGNTITRQKLVKGD